MREVISVLMEESNNSLTSNSTYNRQKDELYRWLVEKENTLEMLWQKTKEDAHKIFLRKRKNIQTAVDKLPRSTNSHKIIALKKVEYKNQLELFKAEYKDVIRDGILQYQADLEELEDTFEDKLTDLREITLNPRIVTEQIDDSEEDFNERKTELENKFSEKWNALQGKVGIYKKAVQSFKTHKQEFAAKVKKVKLAIGKKQKELKFKEINLSKKEKQLQFQRLSHETKVTADYKSIDIERDELEDARKQFHYDMEDIREEAEAKFAEASKLMREAKEAQLKDEPSTEEQMRAAFWDEFKKSTEDRQERMNKQKSSKKKRFKSELELAEEFFGLTNMYQLSDLRRHYKSKLKLYHSDKHPSATLSQKKHLNRMFQKTQEMYEIVKDEF